MIESERGYVLRKTSWTISAGLLKLVTSSDFQDLDGGSVKIFSLKVDIVNSQWQEQKQEKPAGYTRRVLSEQK